MGFKYTKIVIILAIGVFFGTMTQGHQGLCNNEVEQKGRKSMNINNFAVDVAELETGKKEVNIAQIKEILKVTNLLLNGELYKLIRKN